MFSDLSFSDLSFSDLSFSDLSFLCRPHGYDEGQYE
jgi:hypothetical protein